MVPMFKHRQWLCAFIGLFVSLGTARADWPEKQITMVACFAAGGGTDIAARIINTQLGEALGAHVMSRMATMMPPRRVVSPPRYEHRSARSRVQPSMRVTATPVHDTTANTTAPKSNSNLR